MLKILMDNQFRKIFDAVKLPKQAFTCSLVIQPRYPGSCRRTLLCSLSCSFLSWFALKTEWLQHQATATPADLHAPRIMQATVTPVNTQREIFPVFCMITVNYSTVDYQASLNSPGMWNLKENLSNFANVLEKEQKLMENVYVAKHI